MIARPLILAAMVFAPAIGESQESTVFRADTRLVQINVIVRDKDGPVGDLDKSDFILTDRGKPRTIGVFSIHRPDAVAANSPLPANTFSNRAGATSSVTIILLDRLNTLIGSSAPGEQSPVFNGDLALANAKQHLLKFVDEIAPGDRVAIYSLGQSLRVLTDFTGDRAQLKTTLQSYRATSLTTRETAQPLSANVCPPNDPNGCPINGRIMEDRQALAGISNGVRAQTTMGALLAIAAHVSGIPGRKNLVWLTSDLAFPPEALARALGRSDIAIYPVDARGLLPVAMSRSGGSANLQPLELPTAAARGSSAATGQPAGVNIMEELAQETGGRAFVNTNDLTGAVREAIDDGAITYTLGFYVDANSLDGKFHELKVRVKRQNVNVRTQRGYFALKEPAASAPASLLALPSASPLESSAIRVLATVERAPGGFSLSGSIDVRDLQLDQTADTSKGGVDIYLVQQDAAGNTMERLHQNMRLQFTRQEYDAALKTGVVFHTLLKPKDGLNRLRVIVTDAAHATAGSLIIPVSEIK